MVQIQEYDLEIRHIRVQNHLADILSRNPSGMTDEKTRDMTRPDQVRVHHIQVYKDKDLKKELKTLAELQDTDEKLTVIMESQRASLLTRPSLCCETMCYIAGERKVNGDVAKLLRAESF
jgi:uncharacterized membrane protein